MWPLCENAPEPDFCQNKFLRAAYRDVSQTTTLGCTFPKKQQEMTAKKMVSRRKSRQKSQSVGSVSRKKTPKRKSAAASSVSDKGSKSRTVSVKRKAIPVTQKSRKKRPTSQASEASGEESRSSSKSEKREVKTAKTTQAKIRSRRTSKKRKEGTKTSAAAKPGKRSRTESDKRPAVKRARKTYAVDETGEGPDEAAEASATKKTTKRGRATLKKGTSEKVAGLTGAEFHNNLRDMARVMGCDIEADGLKELGSQLLLVAKAIVDQLPQNVAIDLTHMDEAMLQVLPEQLSTHAAAYISRTLMAGSEQA